MTKSHKHIKIHDKKSHLNKKQARQAPRVRRRRNEYEHDKG